MPNFLRTFVILALSFTFVLGNEDRQGRSKRVAEKSTRLVPVFLGLALAACSACCSALYCYRRRTCCFQATPYDQKSSVDPAAIDQVVGQPVATAAVIQVKAAVSVHTAQTTVHDESQIGSDPKLAARRDREEIPPGMALVEIKDRTQGDTAEEMVLELYKSLPNGVERASQMQTNLSPDSRIVFVPESDVQELHQAWQINFQEARRRVEAKLRRRATRLLFFVRGDDGVAVKLDSPNSNDESSSTTASSSSSHVGDGA